MSVFRIIRRIPIIGTVLYIANCYVFAGDSRASKQLAGPSLWIRSLWIPLLFASILASMVLWPLLQEYSISGKLTATGLSDFAKKPAALIFSVVPSLLGFGIGVYALIFALAAPIVQELHNAIEAKKSSGGMTHGSVLLLNSDFAYPLVILVACISIAVFQSGNPSINLMIFTWVMFWYSIIVVIEVIGVLFGMGDNSLLDKTKALSEKS